MAGASDQTIFDMIRKSSGYQAIGDIDKGKVELALNNKPSKRPASWIGQAAWELAKRDTVGPPPPKPPDPPPVTFKKVAPITVREEGGSDQRVCLWASPGVLMPGVRQLPNGQYTDESGALYRSDGDGLEDSAIRSKVNDPRLVGARSMDNRSACDCPPVGDPKTNTGSWTV
jgi:hypothetical protein